MRVVAHCVVLAPPTSGSGGPGVAVRIAAGLVDASGRWATSRSDAVPADGHPPIDERISADRIGAAKDVPLTATGRPSRSSVRTPTPRRQSSSKRRE